MKSLHTRLDERKEEVLEVTKTFGRFVAMRQFSVGDYACFCKWLKEVTGDENYGINPKIKSNGHQTLGDQLVEAMLRKVANLEALLSERAERIAFLELLLSPTETTERNQALAILQTCEV